MQSLCKFNITIGLFCILMQTPLHSSEKRVHFNETANEITTFTRDEAYQKKLQSDCQSTSKNIIHEMTIEEVSDLNIRRANRPLINKMIKIKAELKNKELAQTKNIIHLQKQIQTQSDFYNKSFQLASGLVIVLFAGTIYYMHTQCPCLHNT